ncbi:FixH family protein [Mesorhizobium sp. KR9-304]|uniref:FixH family protein n=1 Tax=Mesorhizobium sp. KR9-304 TaxID=3156614 RepID=UPI0032B60029
MISDRPQGAFTGRHMLLTMLAFFGVIVAVNVTMAWFARSSWTGLVVENSYVASQQFNAKMAETRAQTALGWTGRFELQNGTVHYAISDARGDEVMLEAVAVTFRRPVDDREDHTIALARDSHGYATTSAVADGAWIVQIDADAGLPSHYRETRRIQVVGGSMQ